MKRILAVLMVLVLICGQATAGTVAAFTNIANGDTSDAPTLMTNLNLLRDEMNGSIDNVNVGSTAAIVSSKLNMAAFAPKNLVLNADFEIWTSGAAAQPDDWSDVSTPTVARDTGEQGHGSYALKITGAGADDEGSSITISNLKATTVYRISVRTKSTAGDTASITTTGATTNMDEDSTSTSWATVTGTVTTDGSGTDVVVQLLAQNDTDIVWFDDVTMTEGTVRVGFVPKPISESDRQMLDEDDMTSDSATAVASQQSVKAYVDAKIGQVVNVTDGAVDTGTTALPNDDSIPQITEGDEYMTLAITPASATSKLKIEVTVNASHSVAHAIVVALFQDTTANALAAAAQYQGSGDGMVCVSFTHYMTAGTTSATTFRVRAGGATGATTTFNGQGAARRFGGIISSSITITEILP